MNATERQDDEARTTPLLTGGGRPADAPAHTPADRPTDAPDGTAAMALERMGGLMGFVWSTIPVLVFVAANAFLPLPVTVAVSVGTGLVLTVLRLVRGERFSSAIGSLIGVAVAAGLVAWTGSAKDFFAIGIWISLVGFVVTAASVLVRRPITGGAWNLAHGGKHAWRADPVVLRAHDLATLATAATFGSRFLVQQWLYLADATTALGFARVAMGTPLSIVAFVVTIWAFRRSTKRLLPAS